MSHVDQWRQACATARAESSRRRERVLAHDDLAARLGKVLGISDPARWSGWIPPKALPEDDCGDCKAGACGSTAHRARANRTYIRRQLVDIAAEAYRRDTQPTFDELGLELTEQ